MSADLIGDDACREAFNKARQQRFSVHGLDVVCEPDIFRAGYAAGRDSEIAKRDARIVELEHRCGVYGLELHNATERLQQAERQIKAIKAQEPVAWAGVIEDCASLFVTEPQLWKAIPLYAAQVSEAKAQGEYGDAYQGAREDLAIWKRRALEVEKALQEERIITERLGNALNEENGPTFMGEPVFPAKAKGVVMPEPMKRGDEGGSGEYGAAMIRGYNACLREVARLNATPVQQVSVPDVSAMARTLADRSADACNVNREDNWAIYGQDYIDDVKAMLNAAPAAPAADAGIVDMYRHLQKVTPYRFKKIQDASITDGGDVMYFHKDRFDAALLADMAAHCAAKGVV